MEVIRVELTPQRKIDIMITLTEKQINTLKKYIDKHGQMNYEQAIHEILHWYESSLDRL